MPGFNSHTGFDLMMKAAQALNLQRPLRRKPTLGSFANGPFPPRGMPGGRPGPVPGPQPPYPPRWSGPPPRFDGGTGIAPGPGINPRRDPITGEIIYW